jgi:hypothetical protein
MSRTVLMMITAPVFALFLVLAEPRVPATVKFYDNLSPVPDPSTCRLTLPVTPNPATSVHVWAGGLLQKQGANYSVSGRIAIPAANSKEVWCTSPMVVSFRSQ